MSNAAEEPNVTSYLSYDASLTRVDDLRRQAEHGRAAGVASRIRPNHEEVDTAAIAIRRATAADRPALDRLAALDSARVPAGDVLIAEVGGEPQAALEIATGATIADPFRATSTLIELLELRAGRLRAGGDVRGRAWLRSRSACRAV
jgi:hypothetical protein